MPSCRICSRVQARLNRGSLCKNCFKLSCSKLNVDKSCFKCDENSTDYATTDEEYTLKDEFINDEILSNISAEEREFINIIKGSMLEEKHRIHELQINYINSLNERITCLQRDVEFLKSDILLKNEVIKCFLEQIRGGIKDVVKSPNSNTGSTSISNSEIVVRSSSLLEESQSNTDDTYTLVQNGSIPTKSVDRNLSPTFVSPNP